MIGRGILISSLICALAVGVSACNNPSQPENPEPSTDIVRVQGVVVTPRSIQLLANGESRQLAARIFPVNATDQAIAWESSDSTVATVDSGGRVTAMGVGSGVLITAYTHDGRHESSITVTVLPEARVSMAPR
jgi:uncharacterized protein YjdB